MDAASMRANREHRARMIEAAHWTSILLNAGTMGRKKPIQPLELLPADYAPPPTAAKKATAAQLRRAEVKKWRDLLAMVKESPGLLQDEAKQVLQAEIRLRELGAPVNPSR